MQDRVIGVGVIGCGEIAQLMHLPYLMELPAFRIAALCDISRGTVDKVGEHYGVAGRYTDHRALLADPNVDAVVICTYDHGEMVADAIRAGKHLIVEKPLAFTPQEARPLVEQAERSGLVALVGYMKFYDPGYETGLERIAAIGRPKSIHIHDFAGRFDRYGKLYTQTRITDVPADVLTAGRGAVARRVEAALGVDHAGYRDLYLVLLSLASHDLAVMRGAFGTPDRVVHAQQTGPNQLLAVLDYDDVPCLFDMALAQYEWWDEWIHVHGERDEVRIEFQNPYFRNASATVRLREATGETASERTIPGFPDTSFRREWQHFADCILSGATPRTPLSGGLTDLDLAVRMIQAMPPKRL
ncbi:Gfo/Idh/MocA family oxidoreductase [Mesorhizobium opportunistum]|uniref:Oxidoreductase domain protein n=1 Tax=Mesorhizobium opportunistum (strain LMG 24607 / HAMBI 3007 / WSM2075) TaxID=536019 RepID=F7YHJ3_MESOW|nr:Gfo/Idh/MocA family oxidoreductase [Mesorhizobium opportunistum]AEH90366.1 oxidoreductase domain protein [Mesorhizobium opportunistum WSM2075]